MTQIDPIFGGFGLDNLSEVSELKSHNNFIKRYGHFFFILKIDLRHFFFLKIF